jgi:ketosteroid isomerase-like protein
MMNAAAADAVRDRAWWGRVFAIVDSRDAAGFVELLTPDAHFQFGNAPVLAGRDSIRAAVEGFFAAIASSRHRLLGTWNGEGTAVCEGEVTYTRHDGSELSVPFANVFEMRGDKIAAYRIYIDNSSLFGDRAPSHCDARDALARPN